jgi:hypothetical protein
MRPLRGHSGSPNHQTINHVDAAPNLRPAPVTPSQIPARGYFLRGSIKHRAAPITAPRRTTPSTTVDATMNNGACRRASARGSGSWRSHMSTTSWTVEHSAALHRAGIESMLRDDR